MFLTMYRMMIDRTGREEEIAIPSMLVANMMRDSSYMKRWLSQSLSSSGGLVC
jgi:hypothetical protein